jgi:hypothetical protein
MALTVHWPAARYRLFGSLVPCQSVLSSNGAVMYSFPCGLFFSEGGLWDGTGCRVESSDESQTLCVCSHLSTFAVLMDVHDYVVSGLEWKVTNSCFFFVLNYLQFWEFVCLFFGATAPSGPGPPHSRGF